MPKVSLSTPQDRAQGVLDNMHPRSSPSGTGADMILTPDDLSEGKGNFLKIDAAGNPEGFTLGQLPVIAAHDAYVGSEPTRTTKQNTVPVPVHETGLLINFPLATGDKPPDDLSPGSLPLAKPERPTIRKRRAEVAGYPASSADNPYWMAFSYYRGNPGKHSELSQPVKLPPLGEGQSFKVSLPDSVPLGVTHIGIWLSEPSNSTAGTSGQLRLQRLVSFAQFVGELEMNGPYIYGTAQTGGTALSPPAVPAASFNSLRFATRVGVYRFAVTATNLLGESLPSAYTGYIQILANPYFGDDNPAGYGYFSVRRGGLPPGATGWYLYAQIDAQWYRVYNAQTGEGSIKPFSLNRTNVFFAGWTGSESYGKTDTYLGTSGSPPTEDTTGIERPDSPPAQPIAFGATRPGPGRYYARQVDISEEGEFSHISDPAEVDLDEGEVMEIVFSNPVNRLPNATLVEKGADGLPLGYSSTTSSGVDALNGELVMTGSDDPEVSSDEITVDATREWSIGGRIKIDPPQTGVFSGSFEAVLREIDSSGNFTERILKSVLAMGEYTYYQPISVAGYGDFEWTADTKKVQVVYRFSGAANMVAKVSRQLFKDYSYGFRRREILDGVANSNPAPETTAPPSGYVAAELSPPPPIAPDTDVHDAPDRPLSDGTVLETQTFASLPGGTWTQSASNAALSSVSGSLRSYKASSGSAAYAYIHETVPPEIGSLDARTSLGLTANGVSVPTLPSNGYITVGALRSNNGTESVPLAWWDIDARNETAKLKIESPPSSDGNISLTLDEGGTPATRTTAVVAIKEQSTLEVTGAPTSGGHIEISVGAETKQIPVFTENAGVAEIVSVEITSPASAQGRVAIALGNPHGSPSETTPIVATVGAGDSPEVVAQKLRSYASQASSTWSSAPWLMGGSGRFITLTAKSAAATYGGHHFIAALVITSTLKATGVTARITVTRTGRTPRVLDTPNSIAERIWKAGYEDVTVTRENATLSFTALEPGSAADIAFNGLATGVSANTSTTVQGARDSVEDVAQKIVTTYAGNTYYSVTRSGAILTITALTTGAKQNATFSGGSTGVRGTLGTVVEGSIDVMVYIKDKLGTTRQRRVFTDITTSSVFNISLGLTGAGQLEGSPYDSSRAVVQVWGSYDTDEKELVGLFGDVDFGDTPPNEVALGVSAESSSALTWDVRVQEAKVTDRGERYYRYHDYLGNLLNQVHGFFPPNLLSSDEAYLKGENGADGMRFAVLPNTEYTVSIFARWNFSRACYPFYLWSLTPDGERREIGDLSGFLGASGLQQWDEHPLTFITPADCYEVEFGSRDVTAGEVVCQELCTSLGGVAKRTPFYAVSGSYVATMNIDTPVQPVHTSLRFERERKILDIDADVPPETDLEITYQAADSEAGPFGSPVSDPLLLEQKNVIRTNISATSDGTKTPVIRAGSPSVEYLLTVNGGAVATLLKEDRTELIGGALFANLDRHVEPPEVVYQMLPGSRLIRLATYAPIGNQPEFEVQVFTPEAKRYLEERSGMVNLAIEGRDQIVTIKLSAPVKLVRAEPEKKIGSQWYGVYKGTLPWGQVVAVQDLATESGLGPDSME